MWQGRHPLCENDRLLTLGLPGLRSSTAPVACVRLIQLNQYDSRRQSELERMDESQHVCVFVVDAYDKGIVAESI